MGAEDITVLTLKRKKEKKRKEKRIMMVLRTE